MITPMFTSTLRTTTTFLLILMSAILLSACATAKPVATTDSTGEALATPTPTPIPYEDFASEVVPTADPEQLDQLTALLSLVPQSYNPAVYLDMGYLRSNTQLSRSITPQALGLDVALPSLATGLVNTIAVAADLQTHSLVTPFEGDFPIADMLQLAGGFGLEIAEGGPTSYNDHSIWGISVLGTVLAMASADDTTGVAASGLGATAAEARVLAEGSLDAYDGQSARLLDTPGLPNLVGNVPLGFATVVVSDCERLPLFDDGNGLPGCTGAVVTVNPTTGDLLVFQGLISFSNPEQTSAAIQRANKSLDKQKEAYGFEDLAVRQEGNNLRVRVIVEIPKSSDAFGLFLPSR